MRDLIGNAADHAASGWSRDHEHPPEELTNGRPIPEVKRQRRWPGPVRVRVRMVWQDSGEEYHEKLATHWARVDGVLLVLVMVDDPRRSMGAWFVREDVEPLDSAQQRQ